MRLLAGLLALPLLVACGAETVDGGETAPVAVGPAPAPAPAKNSTVEHPTDNGLPPPPDPSQIQADPNKPFLPSLEDVSAQAICSARSNHASLGTFSADAAFGLGSVTDLAAEVTLLKNLKGELFNELDLTFTYPDETVDGVRTVTTGLWNVMVKSPQEGVDAIVSDSKIDVAILDLGKLTTRCTNEPGGGARSYSGPGDAATLYVDKRTQTSIEGRLLRMNEDGSSSTLTFRAPLINPTPAPGGLDTVCCMPR